MNDTQRAAAAGLDAIIIGAGAAGLAAAMRLSAAGRRVLVLEARARIGGRIFTAHESGWPGAYELGAEFVHGENETSRALMRLTKTRWRTMTDEHWLWQGGRLERAPDAPARIDAVMRAIGRTFRGSFATWWRQHRRRVSEADRVLAQGFVKGFQGAPPGRMSARTLFEATQGEEEQGRPVGGYGRLVRGLAFRARKRGAAILLERPVTAVRWRRGAVEVEAGGETWRARAVVVTVPLGVLRARSRERGRIAFFPRLAAKERLWRGWESGHAIRVVLRLRADAWRRGPIPAELRAREGRAFGFLHSAERFFPVWWSEAPEPVLVGWTGGPAARRMALWREEEVVGAALDTLARLLGCGRAALRRLVRAPRTWNWAADPWARGAYSFSEAGLEDAPRRLAAPVAGTVFFAGEATADRLELGTVHGALASGERAAREVLARDPARKRSRGGNRGGRGRAERV